jgi:hypothetical protein
MAATGNTGPSNQPQGRGALITGWILSILAAIGALITAALALPQLDQVERELELSREGQITDRFNDAVQNLGSDKMGVRLGAVLALQRIMEDSERDQPATVHVLAGYIRESSPTSAKAEGSHTLKPDIQASFEVLAKRDDGDGKRVIIDLSGTRLGVSSGVSEAELSYGRFVSVDWVGIKLPSANLGESDLSRAMLKESHLEAADLRKAVMTGANLNEAVLHQADMRDTDLRDTDLAGADLSEADLRGADIYPARLPRADLAKADLRGLDFTDANLNGADFSGADLRGASLRNIDLNQITMDSSTKLKDAELDPEDLPLAKERVDDI